MKTLPAMQFGILLALSLLGACVGGKGTTAAGSAPAAPVLNTLAVTVDAGPAASTGRINHAYVTVKVCAAGQTQCVSVDHVLLDTGSVGLRLVSSVLTAGGVTLTGETDAQGRAIEECVSFTGGQTWGPVAQADVTLAGESADKLPVQVMDDTSTGAPPPANCGANGTLINNVSGFGANGVLGVGVLVQDCGTACVNAPAAAPLPQYYGCSAGACTLESVTLAAQVTNPIAMFVADNNGLIVNLPTLINANGDSTVQGELIFGLATQSDNAVPATGLAVLGADANGDFTANYQQSATNLAARIDSGTDSYSFNDPAILVCGPAAGTFQGYYCPSPAPQRVSVVNTGRSGGMLSSTVDLAIADPQSFVAGAAAFSGLARVGNPAKFIYGMPFFYGRKVYIGIDKRVADIYTGPYYAY